MLQQERIANGRTLLASHHKAALNAEEIWVLALHEQAAGIIMKVLQPALQLPFAQKQFVVKAAGKKQAMLAVIAGGR